MERSYTCKLDVIVTSAVPQLYNFAAGAIVIPKELVGGSY
jgi:hypothetical protein